MNNRGLLYLNLCLYLYLYLRKKRVEASNYQGFSTMHWQANLRIRPLTNVAGRIPTAQLLRPGWKLCLYGKAEARVSRRLK